MIAEKRKLFFFISFTAFQVLTPAVAGHIHQDALVLNLLLLFFIITSALLVMFPRVCSSWFMQLFILAHAIVLCMLSLPAYRGQVVCLSECSATALCRHTRASQLQQKLQAVMH